MTKALAALILSLVITSVCSMDPVFAKDRQRSGTYTTDTGKSGALSGTRSGNRKEGLTRTQSITTDSGKTYDRTATGTYDKETGAFNKTVTGANGETRTYTGTAQDGRRSGTYTTSGGKSGTFESTGQKNEDGSWTRDRSWTNQDGETKERSVTGKYDKETKSGTRTFTNNRGQIRTVTRNYGNE